MLLVGQVVPDQPSVKTFYTFALILVKIDHEIFYRSIINIPFSQIFCLNTSAVEYITIDVQQCKYYQNMNYSVLF